MACLKDAGKVPEDRERLTILVIGIRKALRQDFSRVVGIRSMGQVEFDEARIALATSEDDAGEKEVKDGGG